MKSLHPDFYADGVSAMDISCGMIQGRPFGGIGILWRKSVGSCIQIHKYNDGMVMAIEFNDGNRTILAVNIYMPCRDRSTTSLNYDEFIKYIGLVDAIIKESEISSVFVIGDWNAGVNSNSVFHFPISICIDVNSVPRRVCAYIPRQSRLNWSKASAGNRSTYRDTCAELLGSIELPQNAVCCSNTSCKDVSHIEGTKDLVCCIVNALHTAALNVIPVTRASGTADDHNIPGWNDIIKAAHSDARDAFKFWVRSSKPRQGEVFDSMRISRAKFKYLLRKCRREEATIRADIIASDLSNNDSTLETCF